MTDGPAPEAHPAAHPAAHPKSAIARLQAEPWRFTFDAAVRILQALRRRADPADAARFTAAPGLSYPAAEVPTVQDTAPGQVPAVGVSLFGLHGQSGVLPRHYTEAVVAGLRNRSRALRDFTDVLAQAMTAFFAAAGTKYRPHRAADVAALKGDETGGPVAGALLAFTGYGTPHLTERLAAGPAPLQHYAGLFAARPRSADRLQSLASDWLRRPVEVEQFVGAWLPLPPSERTSLAVGLRLGQHSRLGEDAAVGVRAWDQQARIVLRVGPLDLPSFRALLPDGPELRRLVGLVRAFVGYEVAFAVNPVLARDAVPPLQLGGGPRLGWDTWAAAATPRRADAGEAVFEADLVERLDPHTKH